MPDPAPILVLRDVIQDYAKNIWGFTGSRAGMSVVQHEHCRRAINQARPPELHHGGAFGSDTQIHALRREMKYSGAVHVWPADSKRRAMFLNQVGVVVHDVMDPLIRNEKIVSHAGFMFATPHTQHEIIRSGTWTTIRLSIKNELPVLIMWPNGQMTLHRDKKLYRVVQ